MGARASPRMWSALKQLAGNSGYHFQLLTAVIEVNELQKRRVIGKLHKHLGSLVGKHIALLGLAFKPNTDDMREASSLVLAARLAADGATVTAFDPVAEHEARRLLGGLQLADCAIDALHGADAAVLVTEWPQCTDLDWGGGRRGDAGQRRDRRPQRARRRRRARGGAALRGDRANFRSAERAPARGRG